LDSDVEAVKSFNDLLDRQYFLGEEITGDIEAAVIGAEKGLDWVKECLSHYENRPFIKQDGRFDTLPVPLIVSKIAEKHRLEVLPFDFFSANNYQTGKLMVSENTYCVHYLVGKWFRKGLKHKIKMSVHRLIYFLFGRVGHNRITKIIRRMLCK
jgi:hypothetical protein